MGLKFLLLLSALWWMNVRGLCKFPDERDWLWFRAMLNKYLIQFSVEGWSSVPSLLFGLRPSYWPPPPWRLLDTHGQVRLSLCEASLSWCTQGFVWALWVSLVGMGFDSKCNFAPPTILLGFFFALGLGVSFSGGIQHSPVDGCSAASRNFGVLTGEDERPSFYSAIFFLIINLY